MAHLAHSLERQCHSAAGRGVFEACQRPVIEAVTEDRTACSSKGPQAAPLLSWLVWKGGTVPWVKMISYGCLLLNMLARNSDHYAFIMQRFTTAQQLEVFELLSQWGPFIKWNMSWYCLRPEPCEDILVGGIKQGQSIPQTEGLLLLISGTLWLLLDFAALWFSADLACRTANPENVCWEEKNDKEGRERGPAVLHSLNNIMNLWAKKINKLSKQNTAGV